MNSNTNTSVRVALTGDVALELASSYFRDAGYEVMPQDAAMESFRPDFVYDVTSHDAVLAEEVDGFFDERLRRLSGSPYSADGLRAIVEEFGWKVASSPKKILAVDADNTLWRGILSEDGVAALRPCAVFQEGLRLLRESGVILVLLTKNDPLPPDVPVDLSLFTAVSANWEPKAGNLLEICGLLNLSPESAVFLDDNPYERAQMSSHLPRVAVAPWRGWEDSDASEPAQRQLVRRLREYFFADAGRTEEDWLRVADYERRLAATDFSASREEYLDSLGLWVCPSRATEADLDRLAQMAAKTNQFNATTIRRTRDEFAAMIGGASPSSRDVFVFRAGDRFGAQGLVCYVVVDSRSRRITDFVMSCRAMGRTLEHFAYAFVMKELGYRPAIDFVPTAKNRPFAEFLKSPDAPSHFRADTRFAVKCKT